MSDFNVRENVKKSTGVRELVESARPGAKNEGCKHGLRCRCIAIGESLLVATPSEIEPFRLISGVERARMGILDDRGGPLPVLNECKGVDVMDIKRILAELRAERERVEQAIALKRNENRKPERQRPVEIIPKKDSLAPERK